MGDNVMATVNEANPDPGQENQTSTAAITARFEGSWRKGERPLIDDYLPAGAPERLAVLPPLILLDLAHRLRAGEMACVEAYLGRYAELASDHPAVINLIAAEYQERKQKQPGLGIDEYVRRFPQYREVLPARLGAAPATETLTPPATTPAPPSEVPAAPSPAPALAVPKVELGTLLPESIHDWMRGTERIRDAAMMATFTGVIWALLAVLCVIAWFVPNAEHWSRAVPVTLVVALLAAFHFWIAALTRARRLWAIWAGLVISLFQIYETARFLLGVRSFDTFVSIVCVPLLLVAVIQCLAYLLALQAHYANQESVQTA
jgi:hypothetical protein